MPLISDGMNMYTMRDGKMVPIVSEREVMGFGGKKVYEYNGNKGILKLNPEIFPPNSLEQITQAAKAREGGITFDLEMVPLGVKSFVGVKEVLAMTPEEQVYEDKTPEFKPEDLHVAGSAETRTSGQKFRDYLGRILRK